MSDSSDDLTDYATVEVPADIEPERYSAEERRSDLLDRVLAAALQRPSIKPVSRQCTTFRNRP